MGALIHLAVKVNRFIHQNIVDVMVIPLLSALIIYCEEKSDIGGSVKMLDQKMSLDAFSKLLLNLVRNTDWLSTFSFGLHENTRCGDTTRNTQRVSTLDCAPKSRQ